MQRNINQNLYGKKNFKIKRNILKFFNNKLVAISNTKY